MKSFDSFGVLQEKHKATIPEHGLGDVQGAQRAW